MSRATRLNSRVGLIDGDGRYAPVASVPARPALTPTNAAPQYWAHRSASYVFPEQTDQAYTAIAAAGIPVLDGDCRVLGDGTLALIHDETVDRTTDGSGNVNTFTMATWQLLNAAAHFPYPKAAQASFAGDLIARYGRSLYLSLEPRNPGDALGVSTAYTRLKTVTVAAGAQAGLIVNTLDPAVLTQAKTDGFKVYFYWGNHASGPNNDGIGGTTITIAQAVAAGADFLGFDALLTTDASVTALVATGIPVLPYNANRRVLRDRLLALGVAGFLTDQPSYLPANSAFTTQDSWRYGVVGHGINTYPVAPVGTNLTITSGALALNGLASGQYVTVGELCPLANAAGTYTLDLDVAYTGTPTTGSAVLLYFGLPDDDAYDLASGTSANKHPASGWMAYLRASGVMSLFKLNNTGSAYTSTGSNLTTGALTANGTAHIKVTVTPTAITMSRTDYVAATLSAGLASGVAVTSLPINALGTALSSGQKLYLPTGQIATMSAAAASGATSLPVNSITPTAAIASGATVALSMAVTDSSGRGGYVGVGRTTVDPSITTTYKNLVIS